MSDENPGEDPVTQWLKQSEGAERRPAAESKPAKKPISVAEPAYNAANGVNPLVWAASRLLDLAPQIRSMPQLSDLVTLRNRLASEIQAFERRAQSVGVSREDLVGARYCLCTILDEAAAQTPWGAKGVWAKQSLLVSFHNETWGGEKYYLLLARLAQNPERHKDLIELLYYCNALGFEGRFKVENNGYTQLEILKRRIATILDNVKGGYEKRLSPHWRGVSSTPPAWRLIPPWAVAMLCGLIGFGVYLWFLFTLGERSDAAYVHLTSLKVPEPAAQQQNVVMMPPSVAVTLRRFLAREIAEGLVDVSEKADRCIVTLKEKTGSGGGLFESGGIEIRRPYEEVLKRIAEALREVKGNALVSGYTDNQPIRSLRFPSNWELSQARAETVKGLLDGYLGQTGRIRAEGRGEADPVANNATPEGRARNRRVEIAVLLSAQAIHRQLNPSETGQ
ncbi:MAG: DotU family type VI secretion system protein [Zoogloeaceae bacterium]|nr:DotU family type VI secretion system protein [Zoogloeaceae bacterium]